MSWIRPWNHIIYEVWLARVTRIKCQNKNKLIRTASKKANGSQKSTNRESSSYYIFLVNVWKEVVDR